MWLQGYSQDTSQLCNQLLTRYFRPEYMRGAWGRVDTRVEGPVAAINRWQRLISFVGGLITLSAIGGELTGYFDFLKNANELVDAIINSIANSIAGFSLAASTLVIVKCALALVVVWVLFFIALRRYSLAYERATLARWIEEVRCFLAMERTEISSEVRRTEFVLFIALPVRASLNAVTPPWHVGRLVVLRGLQIRLWAFFVEVAFLHAIVFFSLMGLSLAFKLGRTLT